MQELGAFPYAIGEPLNHANDGERLVPVWGNVGHLAAVLYDDIFSKNQTFTQGEIWVSRGNGAFVRAGNESSAGRYLIACDYEDLVGALRREPGLGDAEYFTFNGGVYLNRPLDDCTAEGATVFLRAE